MISSSCFLLLSKQLTKKYIYLQPQVNLLILINWSPINILTPRDQNLNFCSPGNVVRYKGKWLLCLQTYPRPDYISGDKVRYGSDDSRIFIIESKDLENWSPPKLLKVKGPSISKDKMGRMIDPYLFEDKDEKGKWWCFYKQNGVSMSYTYDFLNWTFLAIPSPRKCLCAK